MFFRHALALYYSFAITRFLSILKSSFLFSGFYFRINSSIFTCTFVHIKIWRFYDLHVLNLINSFYHRVHIFFLSQQSDFDHFSPSYSSKFYNLKFENYSNLIKSLITWVNFVEDYMPILLLIFYSTNCIFWQFSVMPEDNLDFLEKIREKSPENLIITSKT